MKTIIAATDFSATARHAVYYAADLATLLHAKLILYHAVETEPVRTEEPPVNLNEYYVYDESFVQLEQLKEELVKVTNNQIEVLVKLRFGKTDNEMDQLCYEEQPFAIVMAASRKSSIERLLAGSNTISLSRHRNMPLLLIPDEASFRCFNKIAIATDLDRVTDAIPLNELTVWLNHFNATLEIVNVCRPEGMHGSNVAEAITLQTHFREFNPTFRYITDEYVECGLNKYMLEESPDLLVMIPKRHGLLHKSQSRQFILHPAVPVLVIRG